MHYEMMTVTPELAQRWLDQKNTRNRSISLQKVQSYSGDMKSGRWHPTHQNAIAFYRDGNLADGQHRLAAIADSGTSIEMMVWFGLEDNSAYGIDAHRARSQSDQIKIAGYAEWVDKNIIACARMLMPKAKGRLSTPSPQEIVEFCELHKDALIFSSKKITRNAANSPVRAAVAAAFYHVQHDALSNWCEVMATGIGENRIARTVLVLRERLIKDDALRSGSGYYREKCLRMAMRSIQAYCAGDILTRMQEPKERIYEIPS